MASNQEIAEKLRDMAVNTGTLNCLGCGFEQNCSGHGCAVLKQAAELISQPNEPLTLEQLREMDGEPVWFDTIKRWGIVRVCGYGISVLTKSGEYDVTRMKFYRRPPEGENHHG